ncbi:MAG: adenylate/guanylate cyclase domain-containing protein [Methyloceanibacter sp.]
MTNENDQTRPRTAVSVRTDNTTRKQAEEALLEAGALQSAIFNSANFSSIATDAKGVIQIFNVGAERMLGYTAAEVMNKITPADISDSQELIARAHTLSAELGTPITPGFDALAFKASRGIEDIYELTYIRKDGSRFPAVVSVTALRDAHNNIIGYLLIGTDNTARKQAEEALLKAGALQSAIFNSANFSSIATDAKGVIQIFNVGAERMLGYTAAEVMNKITPADISDSLELIARAHTLSAELGTPITPGFEALVFKASRGIEDIYELTYIRKDGSHFPAVVSVTALRDAHNTIIGYLLIGTDNTARKQVDAEQKAAEAEVSRKNKELVALSGKLAKYLSPQVYNSIFTGAQTVEIASNRKKLTVFFTDIADFTSTTEKLESEELTQLLNRYLTEMAHIASEFGATIDKYIGDAVLGFFGDPESKGVKQDACACVRMAIAMQRRMRELQWEWQELGAEKPFQMRIGINTGFCTVGNFGSQDRMDYTIIGNAVNLAARLQAQIYPGGILIGYETFALVKDDVATEELSAVTAKGVAESVRCYKVLDIYDELVRQGSVVREEEDGLRLFIDLRKQDKAHAIEVLQSVLTRLKQ